LESDTDAVAQFVDVVFDNLDGFAAVRLLPEVGTPDKKPRSEYYCPPKLADALKDLAPRAAEQSRGIYVVPATVDKPGSAKAADIRQTGVILVDIDDGDIDKIVQHLTTYLGEPTLEVASGGRTEDDQVKRHLYWKLEKPATDADLERVRATREIIARKVGADLSFKSLHQPIRVPGTIHGKNGIKTLVSIIAHHATTFDIDAIEQSAREMSSLVDLDDPEDVTTATTANPSYRELATRIVHSGGRDGITRFDALSAVMGHLIRVCRSNKCAAEDAWHAVVQHNAAMIVPPWPEQRLRREFDAILNRDIIGKGPLPAPQDSTAIVTTPHSDDALAVDFVQQYGGEWRHVPEWGAWFRWRDGKWNRDETGEVRDLVRLLCRADALRAERLNEAQRIASDKKLTAVLRVAASDQLIAVPPSEFDAHPWLLNTPGGVIDLQSGEQHQRDPRYLLTQMTTASPGEGCPRWMEFLGEITDVDRELQGYLMRLAGYCLTGSTTEQVFAFFHGSGANGKSVFIQTIAGVLGDYAKTATNDTFMAARGERHLTELAGLRAARLVIVPETEQGRAWAEARIKAVTGGEKIRANFMRQDHFEFEPQFKLIVAGNHRPALNGVGEAMRRRLHLVPFTVTIPPEKRDKNLPAKLLEERDGILSWMLEGCHQWQQMGLAPPVCVQSAVEEYFGEEDITGLWIEDCCHVGPAHQATARSLYASWLAWAQAAGHDAGTQKTLGSALRERGFVASKVDRQRGWHGIALKSGHGRKDDDA